MGTRNGGELRPWGWDAAHRLQRVAVHGATGAVGRELVKMLLEAGHPRERLFLFARRPRTLGFRGEVVEVRPAPGRLPPADVAFLCTPPPEARRLARAHRESGTRVVDVSGAFASDPDVPIAVPELGGTPLGLFTEIAASPATTAGIAALALAGLERAAGVEDVVATTLEAAAGAGLAGILALRREAAQEAGDPSPFPGMLASSVIPLVGESDGLEVAPEERRFGDELRRLLGRPDLAVEATRVRVPVERCHGIALSVRLAARLSPAEARAAVAAVPGVVLDPDPAGPRAREWAGSDLVHVGRIRAGTRGERSLCCFAVGDQLRRGSALNALCIAASLPVG